MVLVLVLLIDEWYRARRDPRDLPWKSVSSGDPRATAGRPTKISKSQKLGQKQAPKKNKFFYKFWSPFWPQNGLQNEPRSCPKIDIFRVYFWIPRFWGLGSLWVLPGSLHGPLEPLLGCLWTTKTLKQNNVFSRFLKMQDFGSLKLLVALIWVHLRPFLDRSVPKMIPKMAPKVVQKMLKIWSKKWTQKNPRMPV